MKNRISSFISFILSAILLIPVSAGAAELTINDCLSYALEHNPNLIIAQEKTESARETIEQAKSSGRPQISASAGYSRAGNGLSASNHDGSYSSGLNLQQSISDWGIRKAKVKAAQLSVEASQEDYKSTVEQVVLDVCNAYYGLNKATRDNVIAANRCENYKKRLKWARDYYEVGTKPKIEVTKAEADLASSKLNLVRAEASIAKYKAQLANVMGQPMLKIDNVKDMLDESDFNISLDDMIKAAEEHRPELAAKLKRIEYAKANLTVIMKGLSPSLSASAGYNTFGSSPFENGEWNAKLSLSLPIYDGGLTNSRTKQALAELRQANAEYNSLLNNIQLEVRTAWENLLEARESVVSANEAERSAKATLELAEGRYAAGVGNSLEISDAVNSYATAASNTVTALYNRKTAEINLKYAIGGLYYAK